MNDLQISRFIKKIEKDDKFLNSCLSIALEAEHKVKQNNCVDIYRDYFEYDDDNTNEREDQLKIVSEYPDPVGKRPVSGVSWSPDGGTSIAITYCSPEFLGQSLETLVAHLNIIFLVPLMTKEFRGFIYDIEDSTKFSSALASQSCMTSIRHNPKRPDVVAAGCYNGQLQWWDLRQGSDPAATIDRDNCHVQPVYSTIWVASKTESEIMTASSDGTIKVCK